MLDPVGGLLRRYADIATRQAWDEYAEIVLADATFRFRLEGAHPIDLDVTGPDGVGRLGRAAMEAFTFYVYVPLNHVAEPVDETTATGRAYALESSVDHDGTWLDVYGAYDDEYRCVDGAWMIAARQYRELTRRVR